MRDPFWSWLESLLLTVGARDWTAYPISVPTIESNESNSIKVLICSNTICLAALSYHSVSVEGVCELLTFGLLHSSLQCREGQSIVPAGVVSYACLGTILIFSPGFKPNISNIFFCFSSSFLSNSEVRSCFAASLLSRYFFSLSSAAS